MNATQKLATGLASIIALGMLTFTSVSADSPARAAKIEAAPAPRILVSLNGQETPQHLTWDMTYGELAPATPAEEGSAPEAQDEDYSDLSMG
jgi:hypothetical protein